jgi:peptide deformylase
MALLPICLFPEPVLRKKSRPVDWVSPKVQRFVKDLTATLYTQKGGIGIAAPQVGVPWRVIIVDVSPKDSTKGLKIMLNPSIKSREAEVLSREGCMSLPDYTANVKRAARVLVEWSDCEGKRHTEHFKGLEAICLQHEVDHLNGVLIIDRVASLKTEVFPRKHGHFT